MKKVALITCDDLTGYITDEEFLEKALDKQGVSFQWVSWRQSVDWASFDCAIVRTPWDYTKHLDSFLEKLKEIDKSPCRLLNSFDVISWNCHKTYLQELQNDGVKVVPTLWREISSLAEVSNFFTELSVDQIVIKPQVGAGGLDTFLLNKDSNLSSVENIQNILRQPMMVQPFLESVVEKGEFSVHVFGGEVSHQILKTPKKGEFKSQEEYGSHIQLVPLSDEQKNFVDQVLNKVKHPYFFARVDYIYDEERETLIELELIEPSLYFRMKEGSADFFVEQLMKMMG